MEEIDTLHKSLEQNVRISDYKLWVDDNPIALIGGEVHYWRLAPEKWRDILDRVQQLDIQVVSTYVCWDFHELAPGKFDFNGDTDPRRNLPAFLDLLSEMGFWIIIRPGPYVYAEWSNGGVRDYVTPYHRLHPEFLRLVHRYMEAVVPVLKPYFATNGGRIILFQPDNEIDPWHQWYTEPLGLGNTPGLFHEFLHERYTSLRELNHSWSSTITAIDEARAVMCLPPEREDLLPRYLDFCRFKHWFVLKAACWMVDAYRKLGVDLPMYLNTYGTVSIQPWRDMEEIVSFVGPDLYPTNQFEGRADEHRKFMDSVRYARSFSRLPYICEFESGIWHGWHYEVGAPSENHYRLMCLSALAAGITGWSWYMLVNRDNWYMSPINEWGRVRPELFGVFQKIVEIYRQIDPTTAIRHTHTSVSFDNLQQSAGIPNQDLLTSLYQADIDYDYYELKDSETKYPLLFYGGGKWLSENSQQRLKEYIFEGGHLVCLGSYPRYDDNIRPFNLLEIPEPEGVLGEAVLKVDINLGSEKTVVRSFWMAHYREVLGEPIRARRLRGETLTAEELTLLLEMVEGDIYTVGFTRHLGQGKLTVLNLSPSKALVKALHYFAGVNIASRSITPGITTALYSRGEVRFLVIINNSSEAKAAEILLDPTIFDYLEYQVQDLISGRNWIVSLEPDYSITARIACKDATVLKLIPAT